MYLIVNQRPHDCTTFLHYNAGKKRRHARHPGWTSCAERITSNPAVRPVGDVAKSTRCEKKQSLGEGANGMVPQSG